MSPISKKDVYKRQGQVLDASYLLEGVQVDGENHVGVVHHDPALVVVDGHRLCHVAEFHRCV